MKTNMIRPISRAIILITTLLPASGITSGSENFIAASNWILTSLADQELVANVPVSLHFDGKNIINGSDGCNQYQGNYTVAASTLRIGSNMISTRKACPGDIEKQASAYISALINTTSYTIAGDYLSLQDTAGNEIAVFKANNLSLPGTDWQVIAYNNGKQAVVSVLGNTQITAAFGKDHQVTGSTGCNNYFAKYAITEESIEIGPVGATRKFCAEPDGLMEQEAQFMAALQSVAIIRLNGNELNLRRADGALAITLVRSDSLLDQ